jgi:diguanylate cyclase (GGDEF)-like protein
MTKETNALHEGDAKIRLRSDRITRTLVSSVISIENLYLVLGSFMQSAINEFGWWAGQAWLKKGESLTPTGWVFATSAPTSILGISHFPSEDIATKTTQSENSGDYVTTPAELVEIEALTWHPLQDELQRVGARHTVIVDVSTATGLGLRILFILPSANSFSPTSQVSLDIACALLPELYRRAITSQQLLFQSTHDELTRLLNRRGLEDAYAETSTWNSAGVDRTVFFLDLDRFKDINDTFGHAIGDEVLCELARRITSASRPVDIQARLGGDEFVIIAEGLDDFAAIERTSDRFLDTIQKDFTTSDGSIHPLRTSLGVSRWQAGTLLADAVARADAQMYRAKASGGRRAKIEEIYVGISDKSESVDPFLYNNSSLGISKIRRINGDALEGFMATFALPNSYSPEMMQDLAKQIRLAILDAEQGELFDRDLLLNVRQPRRSDKTNIELLLESLSETYRGSQLIYVLDLQGVTTDSANIARDLVASRHVKIALENYGLGNGEIAFTKEFMPSFFIFNSDLFTKPSQSNDIALQAVTAVAAALKIPIIIPNGAESVRKGEKLPDHLGQAMYAEELLTPTSVNNEVTQVKGLS